MAELLDSVGKILGAAAVVQVSHKVLALLKAIAGPAAKEAGFVFGDTARAWRSERAMRILDTTGRKLEKRGISAKAVAPDFLLPFLDSASNVGDPDLQELWANLLASAVEDDDAQHPMYIDRLKNMSPRDARVLASVAETVFAKALVDQMFVPRSADLLPAVERLELLGLITPMTSGIPIKTEWGSTHPFLLSAFGMRFGQVVGLMPSRPKQPPPRKSKAKAKRRKR